MALAVVGPPPAAAAAAGAPMDGGSRMSCGGSLTGFISAVLLSTMVVLACTAAEVSIGLVYC